MQNTQIDPQNHEQQLAYELISNTNSSFFLTGRAGTGKTTFLHNVQKLVGKQFITLAPTGSSREGLRGCVSMISDYQYDELDKRLRLFSQDY